MSNLITFDALICGCTRWKTILLLRHSVRKPTYSTQAPPLPPWTLCRESDSPSACGTKQPTVYIGVVLGFLQARLSADANKASTDARLSAEDRAALSQALGLTSESSHLATVPTWWLAKLLLIFLFVKSRLVRGLELHSPPTGLRENLTPKVGR